MATPTSKPWTGEEALTFQDTPSNHPIIGKRQSLVATVDSLNIHDVLNFEWIEEISRPFQAEVLVRLTEKSKIPDNCIGKSAALTFKEADTQGLKDCRFWHGLISHFKEESPIDDFPLVRFRVVPEFWFLSLTKDSQIFNDMRTIDIIQDVLKKNKMTEVEIKNTSNGKDKRNFCVQYQESHFDFISRMAEEAGIFYFFKFSEKKHKLILADDGKEYQPLSEGHLTFNDNQTGGVSLFKHLQSFQRIQTATPTQFSTTDYCAKKPDDDLFSKTGRSESHLPDLSIYNYPGCFEKKPEGEKINKILLEAEEAQKVIFRGRSTNPLLSSGVKFKIKNHPGKSLNDADYVVLRIRHFYGTESAREDYHNVFEAILAKTPFRPRRLTEKPKAPLETAIVVGPKDKEIYTDADGRIKIKFHWDRRKDSEAPPDKRSCWVRVATGWAGSGWGMVSTPRIGQEVVVTFLNHDPDRPLIVGSVFNGIHEAPYVSKDPSQSGIKSHSTEKGTAETYNEIRLTDKKGEEEFYIQAEKKFSMLVKNAVEALVKDGGIKLTLEKGDTIFETKEGDVKITLTKGNSETTLSDGNLTQTLSKGNRTTKITGNDETKLTNGKQSVSISGGGYTLEVSGGDVLVNAKTGKMTFKAMGGFVFDSPTGKFTVKTMGIDLKATTNATMEGLQLALKGTVKASLEGTVQSEVKGTMVSAQGTAMTQVKGAMVMIN